MSKYKYRMGKQVIAGLNAIWVHTFNRGPKA